MPDAQRDRKGERKKSSKAWFLPSKSRKAQEENFQEFDKGKNEALYLLCRNKESNMWN